MLGISVRDVLRCPVCNTARSFSHEHEHRIRTGKAPLTPCRDCRRPHPKPSESDRAWWRDRSTLDEIRQMATAIRDEHDEPESQLL